MVPAAANAAIEFLVGFLKALVEGVKRNSSVVA
jgi:hypothetical protein